MPRPLILTLLLALAFGLGVFAGRLSLNPAEPESGGRLVPEVDSLPERDPEVGEEEEPQRTADSFSADRSSRKERVPEPRFAAARKATVGMIWFDSGAAGSRRGIGLIIDAAGSCLVPLADLVGSSSAHGEVGGENLRVRSVRGVREDLGLALVSFETDSPGQRPPAEWNDENGLLWELPPGGEPRPARAPGRLLDEGLKVEVFALRGLVYRSDPGLLVDDAGRPIAFTVYSNEKIVGLPLIGVSTEDFGRIDLPLAEYERLYFRGSPEELLRSARRDHEEGHHAAAVATWRKLFELEPWRRDAHADELEAAWRAELAGSRSSAESLLSRLRAALEDLPRAGDLWFDRGRLARDAGLHEEARIAFRTAAALDPQIVPDLDKLLGQIYFEEATGLADNGRLDEARDLLFRAVTEVRSHLDLWRLHGLYSEQRRDYLTAADAYRAALSLAIDPGMVAKLQKELAHAERFMEGPGKVIIDYPPRSRTIYVQVSLNDRVTGEFVLDTGATVTMVPEGLAAAAGLDTSERAPRVRLDTAGSSRIVPYTPAGSIQVGDLRLEGLSVVVGDLSGSKSQGLLGMDFLQNFGFENDTQNGRFVIYER